MDEDEEDQPISALLTTSEERMDMDGIAIIVIGRERSGQGRIMTGWASYYSYDDQEDAKVKTLIRDSIRKWLKDFEEGECLEG
jgi:hypothetical protein